MLKAYMFNLAISDITVGTFMVILKTMHPMMETTFKYSLVAKVIYDVLRFYFLRISLLLSVFSLVALTFDRAFAVIKPLVHRRLNKSFAIKVCVGAWTIAITLVTCVYCISKYYLKNIERYTDLIFPIATYSVTIIFIACYAAIIFTVYRSSNNSNLRKSGCTTKTSKEDKVEVSFAILFQS